MSGHGHDDPFFDGRDGSGPGMEDERLADYVDGRMSGRDRERFEAELRVNPQLRQQVDEYRQTVELVRAALTAPTVETDIADRVMASLAVEASQPGPVRRGVVPIVWAVASAAALLTVAIWVDSWGALPTKTAQDSSARFEQPASGVADSEAGIRSENGSENWADEGAPKKGADEMDLVEKAPADEDGSNDAFLGGVRRKVAVDEDEQKSADVMRLETVTHDRVERRSPVENPIERQDTDKRLPEERQADGGAPMLRSRKTLTPDRESNGETPPPPTKAKRSVVSSDEGVAEAPMAEEGAPNEEPLATGAVEKLEGGVESEGAAPSEKPAVGARGGRARQYRSSAPPQPPASPDPATGSSAKGPSTPGSKGPGSSGPGGPGASGPGAKIGGGGGAGPGAPAPTAPVRQPDVKQPDVQQPEARRAQGGLAKDRSADGKGEPSVEASKGESFELQNKDAEAGRAPRRALGDDTLTEHDAPAEVAGDDDVRLREARAGEVGTELGLLVLEAVVDAAPSEPEKNEKKARDGDELARFFRLQLVPADGAETKRDQAAALKLGALRLTPFAATKSADGRRQHDWLVEGDAKAVAGLLAELARFAARDERRAFRNGFVKVVDGRVRRAKDAESRDGEEPERARRSREQAATRRVVLRFVLRSK